MTKVRVVRIVEPVPTRRKYDNITHSYHTYLAQFKEDTKITCGYKGGINLDNRNV